MCVWRLGLDLRLEPTDGPVGISSERIPEPAQNFFRRDMSLYDFCMCVCVCVLEMDQESRSRDKAGSGTLNAATNLSQHAD